MRILIHDMAGHSFQAQLSRELARRGHEVLHLFCESFTSPRGNLTSYSSDPPTLLIQSLTLGESFDKYNYLNRARQEVRYSRILREQIARFLPDVVLISITPLLSQALVAKFCDKNDTAYMLWLQDFYSLPMAREAQRRLGPLGVLFGHFFRWLEKRVLRGSQAVIPISEDFEEILSNWGITEPSVETIHNWAPVDEFPVTDKINPWAIEHDLADKFVFLYSGTLGLKHNPSLLRSLATHFVDRTDVRVVVASEGYGMNWLRSEQKHNPLPNLLLLPYQPFDRYPEVMGSADVLMAVLEPDAGIFSVPSKILSYQCAARPILAAIPGTNLAARQMVRHRTGYVVEPCEKAWIEGAESLFQNIELRGELAESSREYAVQNFDISHIADQFEKVLLACLHQGSMAY